MANRRQLTQEEHQEEDAELKRLMANAIAEVFVQRYRCPHKFSIDALIAITMDDADVLVVNTQKVFYKKADGRVSSKLSCPVEETSSDKSEDNGARRPLTNLASDSFITGARKALLSGQVITPENICDLVNEHHPGWQRDRRRSHASGGPSTSAGEVPTHCDNQPRNMDNLNISLIARDGQNDDDGVKDKKPGNDNKNFMGPTHSTPATFARQKQHRQPEMAQNQPVQIQVHQQTLPLDDLWNKLTHNRHYGGVTSGRNSQPDTTGRTSAPLENTTSSCEQVSQNSSSQSNLHTVSLGRDFDRRQSHLKRDSAKRSLSFDSLATEKKTVTRRKATPFKKRAKSSKIKGGASPPKGGSKTSSDDNSYEPKPKKTLLESDGSDTSNLENVPPDEESGTEPGTSRFVEMHSLSPLSQFHLLQQMQEYLVRFYPDNPQIIHTGQLSHQNVLAAQQLTRNERVTDDQPDQGYRMPFYQQNQRNRGTNDQQHHGSYMTFNEQFERNNTSLSQELRQDQQLPSYQENVDDQENRASYNELDLGNEPVCAETGQGNMVSNSLEGEVHDLFCDQKDQGNVMLDEVKGETNEVSGDQEGQGNETSHDQEVRGNEASHDQEVQGKEGPHDHQGQGNDVSCHQHDQGNYVLYDQVNDPNNSSLKQEDNERPCGPQLTGNSPVMVDVEESEQGDEELQETSQAQSFEVTEEHSGRPSPLQYHTAEAGAEELQLVLSSSSSDLSDSQTILGAVDALENNTSTWPE